MKTRGNKKSLVEQIKYGTIISYLSIVINIALGLVYTPWILRTVGDSNYGLYTLSCSLVAMFLMDFGMSAAVTRFVSNYRANGDQDAINSFIGISIKFYMAICSIFAFVFLVVYRNIERIYSNLTPDEIQIFKVIFVISAVFLVICFPVNICNGILNAYEQFIGLKGAEIVNKVGTVIFTAVALLNHHGIVSLVFIIGLFNLLTFIVKILFVRKYTLVRPVFHPSNKVKIIEIISFSAWSTVNGLSQKMIFNIIPSILAILANTEAITLFGFANVMEGYVSIITSAINGIFLPKVSRLVVGKDNASDVLTLMIKVGRINQSVVSLLLIGLTVLGREFVRLWVGEEYSPLFWCILFLAFPYFVSASQEIGYTAITVLNKVKYSALIGIGTGLLNIVLCILLCPRFGVVGVCAGTGVVFLLRIVGQNIIYKKLLKIHVIDFFKNCQLKMLPGIVLSFIICTIILSFWNNDSVGFSGWLLLCCRTLIICAVYFVCMWLIGWNNYEKSLLKSLFHLQKAVE